MSKISTQPGFSEKFSKELFLAYWLALILLVSKEKYLQSQFPDALMILQIFFFIKFRSD